MFKEPQPLLGTDAVETTEKTSFPSLFLPWAFCLFFFFLLVPTFFHPSKGICNRSQALRWLWGHLLLMLISFPTHHQLLCEPRVLRSRENATLQEWKWYCISISLLTKYHSFLLIFFFRTFKLDLCIWWLPLRSDFSGRSSWSTQYCVQVWLFQSVKSYRSISTKVTVRPVLAPFTMKA